jgi:hypothetical protein
MPQVLILCLWSLPLRSQAARAQADAARAQLAGMEDRLRAMADSRARDMAKILSLDEMLGEFRGCGLKTWNDAMSANPSRYLSTRTTSKTVAQIALARRDAG